MLKISINKLEPLLKYKIKKNYKVVAFDTATIAGVSFIKTDEEFIYIDWCYLEFEKKTEEELLTQMYKEFGKLLSDENFAIVEQVFLGFNRAGSLILAKMGTMAIAQCVAKGIPFKLISAISARSKFFKIDKEKYGKGKSKLAVRDWLHSIGINIDENNCEDAVLLGLLGICEDLNFNPKSEKTGK